MSSILYKLYILSPLLLIDIFYVFFTLVLQLTNYNQSVNSLLDERLLCLIEDLEKIEHNG